MSRFRSLAAAVAALLVASAAPAPGAAQRGEEAEAITVTRAADRPARALRPRITGPSKEARAQKSIGPRGLPGAVRAEQFATRAATAPATERAGAPRTPAHGPVEAAASKQTGVSRIGTGGGDVYEEEPNDTTAQSLADVPVNAVGEISTPGDWDCYAIPVTQGTPMRVEVVADRVFGTPLDSYVVVLQSDGVTEIAANDDGYETSVDSFLTFVAPSTGTLFVCVTDARELGGAGYAYVLNVSPAEPPDLGEVEPNGSAANADVLPLPGLAFGVLARNEYDVYAFNGIAGQTLVVDVDAEIFFSDADVAITFFDDTFTEIVNDEARGFLFFVDDDRDSRDPRFNIVLPYTGVFYIAVYELLGLGGESFYYSINVSAQSGAGAPRVTNIKTNPSGDLMKKVIGTGFDRNGAKAEINSDRIGWSIPAPKKPTTQIKVKPPVDVFRGDVITVVNPDGRRSNPGIVR